MSKLVSVLAAVLVLALCGCSGSDSAGSDDSDGATADGTVSTATDSDPADGGGDQGDADNGDSADQGGEDASGGENGESGKGDGDDDAEAAPAVGPCDAVVPHDQVSDLVDDADAGAMSSGGGVINECTWQGSGGESLFVSAEDALVTGAKGIEQAYRKHPIKGLGEEAGSRTGSGTASIQVYAFVKGSGKAQPVLYTVTWKGDAADVDPLVKIAKRIS